MMDMTFQDRRRKNNWRESQIAIRFTNAAHFADTLEFVRKAEQTAKFWEAIAYLVSLFRNDSIGWEGGQFGPPSEPPDPPREPRNVTIWLRPDSLVRPSFVWSAETMDDIPGAKPKILLTGGMIYRDNDGWTFHT